MKKKSINITNKGIVNTGFVMANNELIRKIITDCGLTTTMIYLVILSHRNTSTNKCFPTNEVLSIECNLAVSNIQKHLSKLEQAGYIIIDSGNRNGKASNYYFPFEFDFINNTNIYHEDDIKYMNKIKSNKIIKKSSNKNDTIEENNNDLFIGDELVNDDNKDDILPIMDNTIGDIVKELNSKFFMDDDLGTPEEARDYSLFNDGADFTYKPQIKKIDFTNKIEGFKELRDMFDSFNSCYDAKKIYNDMDLELQASFDNWQANELPF